MKIKGRVLIILATYNPNKYLYEQLYSILNQTHQDFEIRISDDCSKKSLQLKDLEENSIPLQKISLHRNHKNLGFAKNFLYSLRDSGSNYDYFAFSDQDDIWNDDKVERAIKILNNYPVDTPSLYCSRTAISDEACQIITGCSPLFRKKPTFSNALIQNIGGGNTMVFNKVAYDLIIKSLGNLKHKDIVSHDWWCYQIISGAGGAVYYDPEPSLKYRQHSSNLVGENSTWKARFSRISSLFEGRFRSWNSINCKALQSNRELLTAENQNALDNFIDARKAGFIERLFMFYRSGVYRQNFLGNIGLLVGIVFNRV